MKISEIFGPVIQGEGPEAGTPTIFIRLSGCNLNCDFCDSKYHKNGKEYSVEEVESEIIKRDLEHITITGGEAVLQEKELKKLFDLFGSVRYRLSHYNISLETNGTILTQLPYDRIVVSPKKQAINKDVLKQYAQDDRNVSFKFVYENSNDLWWEEVIKTCKLNKKRIYIMPEGMTRDEQLRKMAEVMEYCSKTGYKFGPRLHTLAYDNRRGV